MRDSLGGLRRATRARGSKRQPEHPGDLFDVPTYTIAGLLVVDVRVVQTRSDLPRAEPEAFVQDIRFVRSHLMLNIAEWLAARARDLGAGGTDNHPRTPTCRLAEPREEIPDPGRLSRVDGQAI
jgi:hypothetical protein